ncbi:MAG: GAF domain-containing protein [Ardenticatenaceae bacterium]|nr:GAF domain-containing protein [Ardenticatenaceae bacterium]
MLKSLQGFWSAPTFADEESTRLARLIHLFTLVTGSGSLLGFLTLFLVQTDSPNLVWLIGTFLLLVVVARVGLHTGRVQEAGWVLTLAVWAVITWSVWLAPSLETPAFNAYFFVVILASLLVGRRAAIGVALVSSLVVFMLANRLGFLATPTGASWIVWTVVLLLVTAVILYFAMGDLHQALAIIRERNDQLANVRIALEARVKERTGELGLAADIGRTITQIRDLDLLLAESVRLIREYFNLYHVQIYLVDKSARTLELKVGTGEIGAELRRQGHRLPIGSGSINGTCAADKRAVVVEDTRNSVIFRPNPLLPDTRSQMSVPLLIGVQLLGVLNLQSKHVNELNPDNANVFEVLAGQLAVAMQNAQLFTESAEARRSLELQAQHSIYEGWRGYLNAVDRREHTGYAYIGTQLEPLEAAIQPGQGAELTLPLTLSGQKIGLVQLERMLEQPWTAGEIELIQAVSNQVANRVENIRLLANAEYFRIQAEEANKRLIHEAWQDYLQQAPTQGYLYDQAEVVAYDAALKPVDPHTTTSISYPVSVQGAIIGYLEAASGRFGQDKVEDEVASDLVRVVADQLSIHIENLRLTQQAEVSLADSRARAEELAFVNRVVTAISGSLEMEKSLQIVLDELADMLDVPQARVALLMPDRQTLRVVREHYNPQRSPSAMGAEIPIADSPATEIALRERRTVIVPNPQTSPMTRSVHALMRQQKIEMLVIIPLIAQNEVLGTVGIDLLDKERVFTEAEVRLAETVVFQAAAALQNAQLFQQTQAALAETEVLYAGTDRIIKADTIEDVLLALLEASALQIVDRAGLAFFDAPVVEGEMPVAFETAATWERPLSGILRDGLRPSGIRYLMSEYPAAQLLNDRHGVVLVPNIATDERFDDRSRMLFSDQYGMCGMINLPLVAGDAWIGLFTGLTRQPLEITGQTLRQIVSLIDQAAIVLQNKTLFADTQQALRQTEQQAFRLATLNELGRFLSTAETQAEALEGVAQFVLQLFGQGRLSVLLLNEGKDAFRVVQLPRDLVEQGVLTWVPLQETAVADVIAQNQVLMIHDTSHSRYSEVQPLSHEGIRSLLSVPMSTPSGAMGVLNLGHPKPQAFDEQDQNLLSQIASLLAAALENRQWLAQARKQVARERVLNNINQKIQGTTTMDSALQTAIQELGKALKARYTQIELTVESPPNGFNGQE